MPILQYDEVANKRRDKMTYSEKILAALGPLASLYADPDVLEILVDAPERIFVEREGRLEDAGFNI